MASHFASYAFSPSPQNDSSSSPRHRPPPPPPPKRSLPALITNGAPPSSYNTLVSELLCYSSGNTHGMNVDELDELNSQAVRLLIPPARFEASKLTVDIVGEQLGSRYSGVIPRTYILSHCDFTANLTLTISNVISIEQLKGWYSRDDVVAEWKEVNKEMCLHAHCYVSGPNPVLDIAAEFRYHIFSKELPLVLKSVLHGDSHLFAKHPELTEAVVWVYFHSSSPKYNRMECWGPLKNAAERRRQGEEVKGFLTGGKNIPSSASRSRKSLFQALFAFLL